MTVLAHRLADLGDEVYETPEVAVEALLSVEQIRVCGSRLVAPAHRAGSTRPRSRVVARDLVDYESPDQDGRLTPCLSL